MKKIRLVEKIDVSLIPRYEGMSAIEYGKNGLTIRKTRLYKFIGVTYSQPLSFLIYVV